MNPITHKKTFADVKVDEKVYILDPKDSSIKEITVVKSFRHPKSLETKEVWVIEAYMPFRIAGITDEKLKHAQGFGTQTTQTFFVPKSEHMALLGSTVPTMLATESKYLSEWMGKNKLGLILPKGMR